MNKIETQISVPIKMGRIADLYIEIDLTKLDYQEAVMRGDFLEALKYKNEIADKINLLREIGHLNN